MILLSELIPKIQDHQNVEVSNEKPFQYLALSASKITEPVCIFLDSEKYVSDIKDNVSMVITTKEISKILPKNQFGICVTENPRILFFDIHNTLKNDIRYIKDKFETKIGEDCTISALSSISKHNVIIGNHVTIEEFVVIRENTIIGDYSIIRAGAKIGGEGYEFKRTDNLITSVIHLGGVRIGRNVEIQYNSCVDKAVYPWDETVIGDYSKIDNLVHIAHAVKIENNVMVVALSGIGGRTVIKRDTWIGFGAIITNGIEVGVNARANIGSVVTKSIEDNASYSGNFAIEHQKFIRFMKNISKGE